jgi:hypothetical protein
VDKDSFGGSYIMNSDRLLPFICIFYDVMRSSDCCPSFVLIVCAKKPCSVSLRRFDLHDGRLDGFDRFVPLFHLFLPVRVEFEFRRQLGSEISRCNVASSYMIQVLRLAVGVRHFAAVATAAGLKLAV